MPNIYAITQGALDPVTETVLQPPAGFYASCFRVTMKVPNTTFIIRTTAGNATTQKQLGGGGQADSFTPPFNPAYGSAAPKYPPLVQIALMLSNSSTPTYVAEWFA